MSSALSLIVFGQVYFLGNTPLLTLSNSHPVPNINPDPIVNHPEQVPGVDIVPNINPASIVNQPEQAPQLDVALRQDYTYTPGIGGHKVHGDAVNWYKARLTCKAEGGDLAIINSAAESAIIARLLAESRPHKGSQESEYAFIGFNDIYEEGVYKTINDELLSETGFYEWASGEPNNGLWDGDDGEDCGTLYRDGKLNDAPCHLLYGFVCELPGPSEVTLVVPATVIEEHAHTESVTELSELTTFKPTEAETTTPISAENNSGYVDYPYDSDDATVWLQ